MLEGHLLNERYQIKRTIGGGGMANVYLARDIILERDVAIKVLRPEFSNDPEFIERFDREAQAATSLSHPNIVNIYDVGEEANILYMVMEYIDGLTLKEYIQQKGALDVVEAIEIMKQLTDAIAHAHFNGLIHRDIKPQNILMDDFGNVKVTDFGIAIALSATSLTQTNSILGSVHYLSPEQARGGMATKKSDIYSLGIVFYELLTGQLPFSGQSPISIALKHLQNNTPSIRNINEAIPQSVENIVLQATSKDPFHRYDSVYAMEEALRVALDPDHMNETVYEPPYEEGDETKAIPIITEDRLQDSQEEDATLIHKEGVETKKIPPKKEEQTPKKQKKPKKPFFKRKRFYLFVLLLIIAAAGIAYYYFSVPKTITVPDVVEMEYEEAKDLLQSKKFQVEKEEMPSDDIEEDHIVKTDPKAGRSAKEHDPITLFVSNGKEKVSFEDHIGENFSQVKKILEDAGYKEVISYPKVSDEPVGDIISQIQPQQGQEVVPSETKVIFEISDGPEKISLNRLEGLSLEDAEEYADDHNLSLKVNEDYSDLVDEGYVITQSPEPNAEVTAGSEVEIEVSLGPEESPPKSHNVTFTVPYKPEESDEDEDEDDPEQSVKIYVEDMENDMDDVYEEDTITEDGEYSITLVIEPDSTAKYKVVRDDEVILERKVEYEEGE